MSPLRRTEKRTPQSPRFLRPCSKLVLTPSALQAHLQMLLRSSIVPLSIGMGRVTACALRGCRALSLRSPFLTLPTLGAKTRPFPRWRWRDAVCGRSVRTESGADQVGGAEQRQGAHGHTLAEAGVTPAHALLFCQFFDEVAELGKDEFFHCEADRVLRPGVEKSTRPLMMPAVARLMMAAEPIS